MNTATQSSYSAYNNVAVNTASQEKLTLMLYYGALKYANQAMTALDGDQLIKLNESVKRTMDIVRELQNTLNMKYEIASDMYKIYDYIGHLLITANTDKDRISLEEAIYLLKEFKDTWEEAMRLNQQQ